MLRAEAYERHLFERFISTARWGNVLQSWAWGEFKSRCGWHVHRLICLREDVVLGALSVLETVDNQGKRFFYAPRGPVLDWHDRDKPLAELIAAVERLARERHATYMVVDPAVEDGVAADDLMSLGFSPDHTGRFGGIQPECVWLVPLHSRPDRQWGLLSHSARRQIRRARRYGVNVTAGGTELVSDLACLVEHTGRHQGVRLRDLTYFRLMGETLAPAGQFTIVLARLDSRPVAGALILHLGRTAWDLYAGTDRTMDVGAGYLLAYESMVWFSDRGYRLYDLGGVPVGGPGDGLIAFKRRFGGRLASYIGQFRIEFRGDVD